MSAGITEFRAFNEVTKRDWTFKPVAFKAHRELQINGEDTHPMKEYTLALFKLLLEDLKFTNAVFVLKSTKRAKKVTPISTVTTAKRDFSDTATDATLKAFASEHSLDLAPEDASVAAEAE